MKSGLIAPVSISFSGFALAKVSYCRGRLALLALGIFFVASACLLAETPEEARLFKAATLALQSGFNDQAERDFAEFVQTFPTSEHVPEAVLLRARAMFNQKKFSGMIELISTNLVRADKQADQFQFWLAKAHFQNTNYPAAATAYASLLKDFPISPKRLEASYGEAQARFKLKEWPRVIDLLQNPQGAFQKSTTGREDDDIVARGYLLLAEVLLEEKDFPSTEEALTRLKNLTLTPELNWQRQFLDCRAKLVAGHPQAALENTTNLLAAAAAARQPNLIAESVALQGEILEQLNDLPSAVQAYEKNLGEATPAEKRRQAFLRIIELMLAQNKIAEAIAKLETFFIQNPTDAASDLALLSLGELRLKEYFFNQDNPPKTQTPTAARPATNFIEQALGNLDKLIKDFPLSPFLGKAQLNRGWCFWTQDKIPESQTDFQAAAEHLPFSEDQAIARFKLADAQFAQTNLTNAASNYRLVLKNYDGLLRVKNELFDRAQYQLLRVSLELGEEATAEEVMRKVLDGYPLSSFGDRSTLLLGQAMNRRGQPAEARALFFQFPQKFPNSELLSQVYLAIARTYVDEQNWEAALNQYGEVIAKFPDSVARPRAEYYRALVYDKAGLEPNALILFTNFVAQFPINELAPRAQNWIADSYFSKKNYFEAKKEYQRIFENTNWPVNEVTFQARMMAGRAAFALPDYKAASEHFLFLINDTTRTPPNVVAEALFALGDTTIRQPAADREKALVNYTEAITSFKKIIQLFSTNELAVLAWGRIGDCYLQLAAQESTGFQNATNATNAYAQVLLSRSADVDIRCLAEIGWGQALEQMAGKKHEPERDALLTDALDHYLNVVNEKILRSGEKLHPFYFREAAQAAARLAEANHQWDQAINLYQRVIEVLPATRAVVEKRIASARLQKSAEKN